jgi:hypothetical protein
MTQEMRKFSPGEAVDFAIIGSGAAGGVLAKEISTAGFRVVVLEQGPYLHEEDFQHNEYKGCGQRGLGASHLKNPRAALKTKSPAMTAASIYSCRAAWRVIAASSIQGTGAQNLASAIRHGRSVVSGIALGPYFASRALASSLVRPGARLSLSPGCPASVGEAESAVTAIIILDGFCRDGAGGHLGLVGRFCRCAPSPCPRRAHSDPGCFQIGAGGPPTHPGLLLDAPQWPSEPSSNTAFT